MAKPIVLTAVTGRGVTPRAQLLDLLLEDHAAVLNEAENRTHSEIERIASDLTDTLAERASIIGVGAIESQRKMERAIDQAQELYSQAHAEMRDAIQSGARRAAVTRSQQITSMFTEENIRPAALVTRFATLSPTQIREVVSSPYLGWTTFQWTDWVNTRVAASIDRELRASYFMGEGATDTVRRIRRVTDLSRNESFVVARTAIQSASNQAMGELYRRNRRVLSGVRWLATLDNRTCTQCGPLDGNQYPLDEGPRPPIHPQCRCVMAPVVRKGILPGPEPEAPTWSRWITGEFGGLTEAQVRRRQERVLGPTVSELIQSGAVAVSDLITTSGRRRNVGELTALAARRAA